MATPATHPVLTGDQPELTDAFGAFTAAAESLERCYVQMQAEVLHLRHELEDKNRELARSQAMSEVTALLAHEVRNPLASLELFAGLLADTDIQGEPRGWLEHLQAGLRALTITVNNVLHFHAHAGPPCGQVELGSLLDWAGSFLYPLATRAKVKLQVRHPFAEILIRGDLHRLQQVVLNLAVNALQAMPGGGELSIRGRLRRQGRAAEILIRDTGHGISGRDRQRIFTPGFTTKTAGSGLGLAVCDRIMEQHHAKMRVLSVCGRGTLFILRFETEAKV